MIVLRRFCCILANALKSLPASSVPLTSTSFVRSLEAMRSATPRAFPRGDVIVLVSRVAKQRVRSATKIIKPTTR